MYVVRAWDIAATKNKNSSYTVGVKMGLVEDGWDYVVLDMVRGKYSPAGRRDIMKQTAAADGENVLIVCEKQPGAAGVDLMEAIDNLLAGYRVEHMPPTGDKVTRATGFAAAAEKQQISILEGHWNGPFLTGVESFPEDADSKDIVDAASMAFNRLARVARLMA